MNYYIFPHSGCWLKHARVFCKGHGTVIAVQQLIAECIAISTVCIVEHRPPTCAVTIHKTCTDQQWNRFQDSAGVQDQRSMCWQLTLILITVKAEGNSIPLIVCGLHANFGLSFVTLHLLNLLLYLSVLYKKQRLLNKNVNMSYKIGSSSRISWVTLIRTLTMIHKY